ncbi:MAG TPA: hypothetical protein VKW04_04880 [Planctomycetota bacterium]|nr:hypothetical protein [Planctomycetota bacterium]
MSRLHRILGCAVLLLGGCLGAVTNESAPSRPSEWEELHLSYSQRQQRWRWRESMTVDQPPEDALRVMATVESVSVPFPPPASDSGESATVTFTLHPGLLTCFPKCRRVVLRFDPHVNPFMEGAKHLLVFLPDGRFWGGTSFHF